MSGNWQRLEKEVAERLKGLRHKRVNYGEEDLDVETPHFIVECKFRKNIPTYVLGWLAQAKKYQVNNKDNRIPLLVWKEKRKTVDDALVIMRFEDFVKLNELILSKNLPTQTPILGVKEAKENFEKLLNWFNNINK